MPAENEHIVLYRTLIEKKFMVGDSQGKLRQRDFEYLASLIEEKSRIKLSVSTLKRLWKNDFTQIPHPSTLDALVSVLDIKDWQEFKRQHSGQQIPEAAVDAFPKVVPKQKWSSTTVVICGGVILVIAGFFVLQGFIRSEKKLVLPENIPFSADKTVTVGVPNTVIFSYDVSGIEADSFFIQQSWNPLNKVSIDPDKNYLSSIYYTPGFHRAKLIVNDSIVKIARVHIKTDGWLPILQYNIRDNEPIYLDTKSVRFNGSLHTPPISFANARVDVNQNFYLRYYNIRDFDHVDSDNFIIETRLKHDSTGNVLCPFAEITILTEEHIYFVPLTSKGCVGEAELKIGEVYKEGRDNNLSDFGVNIYKWQDLKITNTKKNATIFLNDQNIHNLQYKKDFGKIVGLIFTFNGPGSVDYIRLKTVTGETVYNEEFN
jgi:hypothetical protein